MLEPVSTAVGICYLGYATARLSNAVSREASAVNDATISITEFVGQSCALYGPKTLALSKLRATIAEAEADGGGRANALAVDIAEDFVRAWPEPLPLPEFAIEPDGGISMDWIRSKAQMFSVSVVNGNRLAYAWLDGTDKGHGVAYFDGLQIPSKIIEGVSANASYGTPALRAA